MRLASVEELRLMSKVGKLYYEVGLTQDEIVGKMNLSRSKISRLLKQARDEGIVKITVISPPGIYSELETQLERRFRLQEAIVVEVSEGDTPEDISRELGIVASNYFYRSVKDGDIVGISWGNTLVNTVNAMHPHLLPGSQVIQIIGGLGKPEAESHATELCLRLARCLGCQLTLLPAPGIVDSFQAKEVLLSDRHVQRAFEQFHEINIAFVGIGSPTPNSVIMRDSSIITQEELNDLLSKGAVGDIALRFFDRFGNPICSDVDDHVIGMTLEQLRSVERVVGVAGGAPKKDAIIGALRGGFVDVLITDQLMAQQLLSM